VKKITTKELIFFSYFLVIFILSRISSFRFSLFFLQSSFGELVLWLLGAVLGGYFIKLDQLLHIYFTNPEEPLSIQIKNLIAQKRRNEAWHILRQNVGYQKLAFRSALFQAGWVILAFYTLTSTASVLGKTMVMAIGLHLLLDEWEAILSKQSISWLFWQVKREISIKEQKTFLWIMTGAFSILTLLLI